MQVVVQNTRDTPVWIRPDAIELDCSPPAAVEPNRAVLEHPGWGNTSPPPTRPAAGSEARFISLGPLAGREGAPQPGNRADKEPVLAADILALEQQHGVDLAGADLAADVQGGAICLRRRWSFAVLGLRFPVGEAVLGGASMEPEALERCVRLRVPLLTGPNGRAGATGCGAAWFDETRIWCASPRRPLRARLVAPYAAGWLAVVCCSKQYDLPC